jgi:putative DNA primase/helicase
MGTVTSMVKEKAPISHADLVDVKRTSGGHYRNTQPFTQNNLAVVLGWLGLTVRFDVMRHTVAFFGGDGERLADVAEMQAHESILDTLTRLDIAVGVGRLAETLAAIAWGSPFHPMEDWLAGLEWDGGDYIAALGATVVTDNPLWLVYLENWLVQVVDGVCGWRDPERHGLPYCLVLSGAQGIGKTRWFRALGCGWLRSEAELHLNSSAGKDHQIEVLRWPMAELSELGGVFRKSDSDVLKGFLSKERDSLREPYGRRAVSRPRMTAFCGSVNEDAFLVDESGTRRFWPVAVEAIRVFDGVDMRQVWAQARAYWGEDSGFHLTQEENRVRIEVSARAHTVISKEVETVAAYWEAHKHCEEMMRPMNRTEILDMLGFRDAWNKTRSEVGAFLADKVGKMRTLDGKQRAWMFPYSEFAHDSGTWKRVFITPVK